MVLSDGKLEFFNELSTKILNEVTQMKDFVNGVDKNGHKVSFDPQDMKIFYLYDSQDKSKKNFHKNQPAFSLREIQ